MTINELNNLLVITNGTLTLGAVTLPGNILDNLLVEYNNNSAITIADAVKTVGATTITVTGQSSLLGANNVNVNAIFGLDTNSDPTVIIYYELIGSTVGANAWTFSTSFPDLPSFQGDSGGVNYLDTLVLTNTYFILCTEACTGPQSGQALQAGLNFASDVAPVGLAGIFTNAILGVTNLSLQGTINLPTASQVYPPLAYESFAWEGMAPVPGINLSVALGVSIELWTQVVFGNTLLHIYTPATNDWMNNNTTYRPVIVLAGTVNLPSLNVTVDLYAYTNATMDSATIIGNFTNVSFQNFADLTGLANGGGLIDVLPQEIQTEIAKLSSFSLEKIGIALQGTADSNGVQYISITVGLPGASWEVINGFTVSDITTEFLITNPFDNTTRLVSLLFGGTMTIAGVSFGVMLQVPDFAVYAQMDSTATLPLSTLFTQYLPSLPAPPDLTINEMTFNAISGQGYSFFINLADAPGWTIDVTPTPLTISDVMLQVTSASGITNGSFSGSLSIGSFVDIDATYDTPGDFTIQSSLPDINLSDLIGLLSNIGITLPSGFDLSFNNNFIIIQESGGNATLSLGTNVTDFGLLILTAQQQGTQWGFGFGMEVPGSSLSNIPGLGILSSFVDFVGLEEILLVVSSIEPSSFSFPDVTAFNAPSLGTNNITLPAGVGGLVQGINLYAKLSAISSQGLQALATYLGIDADGTIGITIAISLPDPATASKLFLSVSAQPNSNTTLTGELGVLVQNNTPGAFLNGNLKTTIQGQPVSFDVTALVVPNGVFVSGTMTGTITFSPVTLSNLAVVIGIDLAGIPSFGVAATIDVSTFDSSVAVFFDSADPGKSMVAGAISDLTLADVVTAIAGQGTIPTDLSAVLAQIGIKGLQAFSMPSSVGSSLDNLDIAAVSAAFTQYGSISIPSQSSQVLLRVNTAGALWSLTDMTTMMQYTLTLNGVNIDVALEAQLYIAPQDTMIGTLKFPQAIHVIAEIDFLIIKEQIKVIISTDEGILVDMSMAQIVLLNADFFSITGAGGVGGPQLSLCTYSQPTEPDPKLQPPHFLISGELRVLSVDVLDVYVMISTSGATFSIHEQMSPLVSFDLNGTISGFDNMNGNGSVTVGLDQNLDLGPLGNIDLDCTVSGTLGVSLSGTNAAATVDGQFTFQNNSFSIPQFSLDVNGAGLSNLADTIFDQCKAAVEAFLEDPTKWLDWINSNVIQGLTGGAEQIGQILQSTYNMATDTIIQDTKSILNYTVDQVSQVLNGAGVAADAAAAALQAAGYTATEIGSGLQSAYNYTADQVANALETLGYTVSEITDALENIFKGVHVDIASFPPHVDTSTHIDTPAGPHADSNLPPHGDTNPHADTPAGPHGDTNLPPHVDGSTHIDTPAGPHGDTNIPPHIDGSFIGIHGDTPAGPHADTSIPPHGDANPHADTPAGPHADADVPPHVDTTQHIDTPAGPHGDTFVPPHIDTTPHADTPSGHIDIAP